MQSQSSFCFGAAESPVARMPFCSSTWPSIVSWLGGAADNRSAARGSAQSNACTDGSFTRNLVGPTVVHGRRPVIFCADFPQPETAGGFQSLPGQKPVENRDNGNQSLRTSGDPRDTLHGSIPNRRAAARSLSPSIRTACRSFK